MNNYNCDDGALYIWKTSEAFETLGVPNLIFIFFISIFLDYSSNGI